MRQRPLTILMIDKYYFIMGGVERYFFELKSLLESHGHRVIPFSMHHARNTPSPYESYFVSNVEFRLTSWWQRLWFAPRIIGRILYSFEARRRLERLIRRVRPDVAHLHMIDHQISPSILHTLKKHGIPVVQTVHQYKMVCPNYLFYIPWRNQICTKCLDGNIFHPIIQRCHSKSLLASGLLVLETFLHRSLKIYRLIDRFHVPSRFMGEMLKKGHVPAHKIIHHNYCIRIEDFPQSHKFDNFYVYVGRLSPEKGVQTLLKAAAELPDHPLVVIGDGQQREEFESYVKERGLNHIRFTGNVQKHEVIDWVSRARFVVLPSEVFENSALAIYEAFSLGKPVVGADIGGITELVVHDKTGLLFPSGDANRLKTCIQQLMPDIEKCREMGEAARQKAEYWFSGNKHYPFIMDLYHSLLPPKGDV
ncbi:glycosyltransferase family 1 protein [bacterium]|nr:MAG: glycosyltransferase family 1 protein [bacterium]